MSRTENTQVNRFNHKTSRYERPNDNFRCGRGSIWGKPCSFGPDKQGKCGGIAECAPFKNGDRWECRRPSGACDEGPGPNGTCCHTQPPCTPIPSGRRMRGRYTLVAFVTSLAILSIAAIINEKNKHLTSHTNNDNVQANFFSSGISLFDPGELSDIHRAFTGEQGCEECHFIKTDSGEERTSENISLASLSHPRSLQEGCVRCHVFNGPANTPHNQTDTNEELQCNSCHTEHKGRFAELVKINNKQCANCHEQTFATFNDHVAFDERFPHQSPSNIVFDHAKHLNFYFDKADDPSSVPTTCTACHITEGATRKVKIDGFQKSCGECHEKNIVSSAKSDLALLELPKLKIKNDEDLTTFEQCGAIPGERFKAAGKGRSTPFQDWLLGAKPKSISEYSGAFCQLLQNLDETNIAALIETIQAKAEYADSSLFAGLSPEGLAQMTSAWINNERYRPIKQKLPKKVREYGWYIDNKGGLKYRPTAHADPVAIAWINFAQQLNNHYKSDSSKEAKLATRFAKSVLSNDGGLGACLKCHVPKTPSMNNNNNLDSPWIAQNPAPHHRFKFNHSSHLSFVGAGTALLNASDTGCAVCHQLNSDSTYADTARLADSAVYTSNFYPIKNEICAQCHNENSVKDDCTLCHQYHEAPAFTERLSTTLGQNHSSNYQNETP